MPDYDFDAIIIGASLAGSTVAAELAAGGKSVLLLDRAFFPRDKPCGEGVMPVGAALLEAWGVRPPGSRQIRGVRLRQGDQVAERDFPDGKCGLCVKRRDLDLALARRAASTHGVTLREGCAVTRVFAGGVTTRDGTEYHAPLLLGCDGPQSIFHKAFGIEKSYRRRHRYGVTGHIDLCVDPVVEITFFDGGQVFSAPCGNGEAAVTLLLEKATMTRFAGRLEAAYLETLKSVGGFGNTPILTTKIQATGALGFSVRPICKPGMFLLGDSAGFFDPISGEGMTVAMLSARLAAEIILNDRPLKEYAERHAAMLANISRLTRLLLGIACDPAAVHRTVCLLSRRPRILHKFLGIVAGTHQWNDITLFEKLYLVAGSRLPFVYRGGPIPLDG